MWLAARDSPSIRCEYAQACLGMYGGEREKVKEREREGGDRKKRRGGRGNSGHSLMAET